MASRSILRSAIAAALIGTSPVLLPAVTGQIAPAAAAVNVSINFNTFYNGMSSYGDWTFYRGAYVWVPTSVGPSWRPYTLGHWVWTDEYGWLWVSDEPFGWAAYHYGRWGYSNDFGWYWVPGRRWAPAWVSWRNSDDIVGWAPLPPEDDETVVNININTLPDYYWNVVPARSFLSPRLNAALVFDTGERRRLFQGGRPGGNVIIRNNIVVNNFIDVNFISKRTGQQIRPVKLVKSGKPGNAMLKGDQVTAFTGDVGRDNNVKPAKIVDANKVKVTVKDRVKRDKPVKEVGLPDNGTGQGAAQGDNGQTRNDKKLGKPNNKKGADQGGQTMGTGQTGAGTGQDNGAATDQIKTKKNRKKLPPDMTQQNGGGQLQPGGTGQAGTMDQGTGGGNIKKNKKKLPPGMMQQNGTGGDQLQPGGNGQAGTMDQTQPGNNKKNRKKLGQPGGMDMTGQGGAGGDQGGGVVMPPKKLKKNNGDFMQQNGGMNQGDQMNNGGGNQNQRKLKKLPPAGKPAKCDPQTDPTCPPTLN